MRTLADMLAERFPSLGSYPSSPSSDKVMKQDREIREMKQKIAEVMAVSPGVSYMAPRHPVPQYLTKLLTSERYMLTPRALMYQCLKK